MGQEAFCKIRLGRKVVEGKALLESQEVIFRGTDLRLKIPFRDVTAVDANDGWLRLTYSDGTAAFELGSYAAKWAEKIRNPKSLIEKLGVKAGMRVSVLAIDDPGFRRDLANRTDDVAENRVAKDADLIFLGAERTDALDRLRELARSLKPNGAIWVVYPKGQKYITESAVLAAGKRAGLVDVKVASFSPTHTALKFVIPVGQR
ncbi:MAG TPA: DUF3052 family protein [Bryobacteraceae bacterium]|nr:DUF3052 family protein [Bryobacteraceae bacterium]